ncbi:alpha/beta fold hydrolase [Conexibacter sp. CPCC 206217]|uniref:alpha/beta fold hydrolase n=1 Tax=Conexibacter sp. CPCC 206217 TaxID=3064574 RepID=UPI00272711AF|nr:alpha/beta fold hydrolase [Conexibacter sp. CPCC 206217]MDO8209079.1 alpha/beta fold hydrolase [Conexibacter sp. CPCC 206217]
MPALPIHRFCGRDGASLAYRELGEGRTVVLIHGFLSTATVQWILPGHAAAVAAQGRRVVMPDLRGHGDSARPHDAAAYPSDVVTDDAFALIEQLGLTDYDLGGYSLGGRTTVRMLVRGATPGRAIVAGMGLNGVARTARRERGDAFRRVVANFGTIEPGSPGWEAQAFMQRIGADPVALGHILGQSLDTPPEALARITTPTLVAMGADDDPADAEALATALPHSRCEIVPGDHVTAASAPQLGAAITAFLTTTAPPRR